MPNAVTWKFRYALLTYAQCGDLDPWAIVHLFTGLRAECIVGREAHQDEGIHLHVFVDFGRVFRSRRTDAFDVEGRHPNVQHVNRTPWVAYDYAIKEGDVVAGGAERPPESSRGARSLVLIGPTRMGKTLWARSLGNHAYFGGLFSLDEDIENVDYAVFDDMMGGLEFWHAYKFWLGAQKQFYATDKYRGKKLLTWGRPCIYVANNDPRQDKNADVEWLEGNCVFHYVSEPLFA
ncbi:Rep [Molossus molossus associated gemykibivirus 5]|nr:Rep [Molossus molossus associated gemykibivirus 5]